jgi:hypothetical protein
MMTVTDLPFRAIVALFRPYGLHATLVPDESSIPGSYWGEPEAGLIEDRLYLRNDTPLHSMLHEACHFVCMPPTRRASLHTDAGGDFDEENAVCYLQILLAGRLPGYSAELCMEDMDSWGYTFRLGSAKAWFERDADDARAWLLHYPVTTHEVRHSFSSDTPDQNHSIHSCPAPTSVNTGCNTGASGILQETSVESSYAVFQKQSRTF